MVYYTQKRKACGGAARGKEPLGMDEMLNNNKAAENENDVGSVTISEEVVAVIAGVATAEVKGVSSMSGTLAGGIAEILGKKNMGKGVKVTIDGDTVEIDLHITVVYGAKVPEVAWEIQEKVKKSVESMTGLKVDKVNIYIEGVVIEREPKKETRPPKVEEKEAEEKKKESDSKDSE